LAIGRKPEKKSAVEPPEVPPAALTADPVPDRQALPAVQRWRMDPAGLTLCAVPAICIQSAGGWGCTADTLSALASVSERVEVQRYLHGSADRRDADPLQVLAWSAPCPGASWAAVSLIYLIIIGTLCADLYSVQRGGWYLVSVQQVQSGGDAPRWRRCDYRRLTYLL